jgi:hypothetical protein
VQVHFDPIIVKVFEILLCLLKAPFAGLVTNGHQISAQRDSHQICDTSVIQESASATQDLRNTVRVWHFAGVLTLAFTAQIKALDVLR